MSKENTKDQKKSKSFKIILGVVGIIIVAYVIFSVMVGMNMNAKEVKLGNDIIPTMHSVVGKRNITGVTTDIKDLVTIKTISYKEDANKEDTLSTADVTAYIEKLQNNGYFVTKNFGITNPTAELGIESKDSGRIIRVNIKYDTDKGTATITYTKAKGTLTRY